MPGVLYIVATPIGNLQDISLRAIDTLKAVDLIAAEDTRHSARLLEHFGIETPMLSCHDHNEHKRAAEIIGRLERGENIALISDAGTPLISDPGFGLVRLARAAGITVSPIPGASSVVAALSAAGLPSDGFRYCGFLPSKGQERRRRLLACLQNRTTLVLFEASHRILDLLQLLVDEAPQTGVVVAKELTKRHERFMTGLAGELLAEMRAEPALTRGEFVVLIDNAERPEERAIDAEDARLMGILCSEMPVKSAAKIAARITGKSKNELYSLALETIARDSTE